MSTAEPYALYVVCPSCDLYYYVNCNEPTEGVEEVFVFGGTGHYVGAECPSCDSLFLIELSGLPLLDEVKLMPNGIKVYHKTRSRPPLPPEVPLEYRKDYDEASDVLHLSPKASAALSRRALQYFLATHRNIRGEKLAEQIDKLLKSGQLPPYISNVLDVVRIIGNVAAHPVPDVRTGEIIEVEPGEAEWLLDVLRKLFDFYFVQPDLTQQRKEELEQKTGKKIKSAN